MEKLVSGTLGQDFTEKEIMYMLVPRFYYPLTFSICFIMNVNNKPPRQENMYQQFNHE